MNVLHLFDIHYRQQYPRVESGYPAIFNNMTNPTVMLADCVERARARFDDIDLAVITGDLTEHGTKEDYVVLRREVERILDGIPYVVTPGNHDILPEFWKGWIGEDGREDPYNTVFDAGEIAVVSLDSTNRTPNGEIGQAQVRWLAGTLKALGDKPALVITHHHLMTEQGVVPPVPRAEGFDAALSQGNVIGILTGHTHHTFTGTYLGIPYFTTAGMSFAGWDAPGGAVRYEEMYGYGLYTIENEKFTYQTIETFATRKLLGNVVF